MLTNATKEADDSKEDSGGCFVCAQCGLEEMYQYKGSRPPFAKCAVFLEDAYLMRDPFSPPGKGKCLVLGSDCVKCGQPTCCAPSCSVFYSKRFCLQCVKKFSVYFPSEILSKLQVAK